MAPGIVGVWTGHSYAYVLRPPERLSGAAGAASGVALVDAGSDSSAAALLAELARTQHRAADVHTIVLTHGHIDHTAGLMAFGAAELWASPADGLLLRGELGPRAAAMRLVTRLLGPRRQPRLVRALAPGGVLTTAGHTLRAVPLPGHTPGSMGLRVGKGLLAGDAAVARGARIGALTPYPAALADAPAQRLLVLQRLGGLPLAWIADGHTGLTQLVPPTDR